MIPILYEQGESLFLTNGIGRLTEAVSCSVEKVRNGVYDLEMVYPMTGKRYADLAIDKIIYARHSDSEDRQPFRIYKISRPLSGKVTVYAQHVSRDLSKVTVMPFTASGIRNTLAAIPNNTIISTPFTFWTDKTTSGAFSLSAPMSVMALLGGTEGSVLDVFGGGDYEFDKWAVKLHDRMGADNGVSIRYGKNLTDLNKNTDGESLYNAVVPFYLDSATGNMLTLSEEMVTISGSETFSGVYTDENGEVYTNHSGTQYTAEYSPTRVIPLDLSEYWETTPTVEQLRSKAEAYLRNNGRLTPEDSLKISFVALWQTDEYADYAPLQRVNLGDTVHVYYSALGINAAMRVVRTEYDVLAERYNSIELGSTVYNLSEAIRGISEQAAGSAARTASAQAGTAAQTIVEKQTALITGQTGGYFVTDTDEAGRPIGWLLMDSPDKTTARNVIRANQSGIGFSQNGYNGPFVSAWTIDGSFNADFIQTGTLSADRVKAGILTDVAGKFSLNMETGALTMQDGTFTGTVNATGGTIGGFTVDAEKLEFEETATTYGLVIKPSGASGTVLSAARSDWQILSDGSFGIASGGYYYGQRYTGGSFYAGQSFFTNLGLSLYNAYTGNYSQMLIGPSSLTITSGDGLVEVIGDIKGSGAISSNNVNVLNVQVGEVISVHSGVGGVWPATCVSSGKNIRIGIDLPRVVSGRSVSVSDWSGLYLKRSAGGAIYYGSTNMNNLSALPTGVTMTATVRGYTRVEIDITGENAFVTASNGTTAITDRQTIQAMFTRLELTFS